MTDPRDKPLFEALMEDLPAQETSILIALCNWARQVQKLYDGTIKYDDDALSAMLMFLNGVGPNPLAWQAVEREVRVLLMNEFRQWYTDAAYRRSNSLIWCVLKTIAPRLAEQRYGWSRGVKVAELIAQRYALNGDREADTVPSISAVERGVEQMRATTKGVSDARP